jgi:M6 family metalloprotease-like protein
MSVPVIEVKPAAPRHSLLPARFLFRVGLAALAGASFAAVYAQNGADAASRMRAMNGRVLSRHDAAKRATPAERASLLSQAHGEISERAVALATLIRQDPAEALRAGFSEDLLEDLRETFLDSADLFESHSEWRGTVEILVADDPTGKRSSTLHRLKANGATFHLYFSGPPPKLISGDTIQATGMEVAGAIAVQGGTVPDGTGGQVGMACGQTGAQNVATILVNLPNYTLNAGVDQELLKGVLYGNSFTAKQNTPNWSVDDFWQQNSDGKTSAPYAGGNVAGPFQLSSNFNVINGVTSCDYMGLAQAAINAADGQINFANYNRVMVVFPYNGACTWAGLSSIGCWSNTSPGDGSFTSSITWLRSDQLTGRDKGVQLATHELGHGLGLHHANTREYSGPPRQPLGVPGTQGMVVEYGDLFSTMGSWNFGFYAAPHAQETLSWLGTSNYQAITTSGQYSIEAYETRNAPAMVKALKVRRDTATNSWIWIEYRTNTGLYNSQLNAQVWSGALIHYTDAYTSNYSHLLDFTPATTAFTDPVLAVGQTWVDPYTNLAVTVNSISGTKLNVTVTYGAASCVRSNPVVSLAPPNPTVNPSSTTLYTVSVENKDTTACPATSFNLTSAQPSGFTGTLSPTSLSIQPGTTLTANLSVKAGSTIGTFPISATATNATDSRYTGTGSANITVSNVCVRANPTLTLTPASAIVGPAGSRAFTVAVKNNDTSLCGSSYFLFTSSQPAGLTGTFSKTSLQVAAGATASVTLTEKAGTSFGTFTFTAIGTNKTVTSLVGTATGIVTVEPCTMAAPTVTLSPSSQMVAPGLSKGFSVSVKNNHSATCANASFALSSTQPSGFTGTFSATSLTLASGATGTVTLTEKAGTTAGTFSFTARATTSSTYVGTATGTVDVVPCTMAAPTVALSPASASVNGAGTRVFTVTVTNNHSPSCANAAFAMSSTQPSGFTGTFSATSLTLASGTSGSVNLTEKAGTVAGTFSFTAIATTSSTYKGNSTGTVTVVPLVLTLTTDKSSYNRPAPVYITARLAGATGASGASVKFTLTRANGTTATATVTTNASGDAVWTYSLTASDPLGSYKVAATSTYNRVTYTATQPTFTVQ